MANGRCRMHGGPSTGPKTAEGRARSGKARWKHGRYSKEAVQKRQRDRLELAERNAAIRAYLKQFAPRW